MSSVLAKINAINKASTDAIPSILSSISETLENNLLSEEEMQKLCNAIIRLVNSSPPAITRAALSMSDQILSKKYPPNFPLDLFNSLKSPLSSSNKQLRSTLIDIAIKCFLASYPSDFWGRFGDLFSQTPILKEIGLDLFMKTITEYPDYEINELIPKVFSCLSDSSSTVRSKTYEIVTLLYAKNPKSIEKRIKKQFPNDFNDILKRISGNTKVTKKGSYVEESSKASLSPEEIERSLREEFKNACSDINPKMGFCKFSQVGNSLKRTSEWKDRMKALQTLVSFAKSSPKPDTFVNGFKSICDDYISCLCDARSTLSKYACLTLVAMARCLKSALDQISDRLIPPLLGRTTHGTLVISLSSEIAVIEYVTAICGKKIKKVLEDNVDSNSVEIRITVVKSILVARKVWKPSYTKGFDEIIQQKKHDPSPIVRQLVENNQFESPKKRVPFQELNEIYETPRMKEPEKRFNEGETFDFTSLQTENKPQKAIESKIAKHCKLIKRKPTRIIWTYAKHH
ncbi:hypothetical protein GPJ56_009504 [Histomonas meleagridis]|uniref:uncharacterized protein n=1 Tax=Histomonas meleagridis TaxID=135588 RepID=UPI003559BB31|nr:hypothetical protein GPJ56_009504 [Histomonas meleagridis]KAH0804645.1 hypothetical protein GO595_002581 [Histomonas meleagridis]